MSHGPDLFALSDSVPTEPSFELALRGYDKKQVDRYVATVEAEVVTLATEREQAYAQVQALSGQLQQLRVELANMRHRTGTAGRLSFRHLGPRVEQILALAEEQAEAIRAEAREHAAHATHDFETTLTARRDEEEQADERRRVAVRAEVATAEERARAAQEQARRTRAEAEAGAKATADQARHESEQRRTQLDEDLGRQRSQADQECDALVAAAKRNAERVRGDSERQLTLAEQRIEELRQQHAEERERLAETQRQVAEVERRLAELRAAIQDGGKDTPAGQEAKPEQGANPGQHSNAGQHTNTSQHSNAGQHSKAGQDAPTAPGGEPDRARRRALARAPSRPVAPKLTRTPDLVTDD
jgi:cell division septum initiation protein DivIVA